MKIITIPHPTLRKTAQTITKVDEQLIKFITELEKTLDKSKNPHGIGLAAPQVDKLWRIFATGLSDENSLGQPGNRPQGKLRHFINPVISRACKRKKVLGVDPTDPDLEGCLSIPELYGPIPRHRWIELEFQTLENGKLQNHKKRFDGFHARVIQHELDHLDGILFTDYSLEKDLPVYRYSDDGKRLIEIDKELIRVI
jgi:peptide deformylase